MREAAPAVHITAHNMYAVGRWKEVGQVAADHHRFATIGVDLSDIRKPGAWRPASPITEIDPPEHTGVRAVRQKILSPIVVRQWREQFEQHAGVVAEKVLDHRDVDGVVDITEPFARGVFPKVLGIEVPPERLIITGELNFNQMGPNNERLQKALKRTGEPVLRLVNSLRTLNRLPLRLTPA
ncbi:MAG: hypothetical protein P4L96_09605 [Rhodoferax sp.]|nr:hypothetical protein [Rhodoferax sp.]